MIDHHDESLLAVSMYLLSRGEPKDRVTDMLMHFGWDEPTARRAVKDVLLFLPDQKSQPKPRPATVLLAWVLFAALILLAGNYFFVLPSQWVWRIVTALSLAAVMPTLFLLIWGSVAIIWDKIDR